MEGCTVTNSGEGLEMNDPVADVVLRGNKFVQLSENAVMLELARSISVSDMEMSKCLRAIFFSDNCGLEAVRGS